MNPAIWSTFGPSMSYNPNLVLSLLESKQQSQSLFQSNVQLTTQQSVQPTGGRMVSSTEHEMVTRTKILIEPEGDMFKPHQGVMRRSGEIIKGEYPGVWPTWRDIPIQQRDFWFNEFKKYYYWLPHYDLQVRRNFEAKAAKQLKNLFAYARKTGKVPDFVSPDNWAQLQKYRQSPDFQKLSSKNKKNRSSNSEGVGPSLHTCGAIPITEWRRRMAVTLRKEPTFEELYKNTHMHRTKDKQGNWVCKKSKLRLEDHRKRWKEYRSSQPSTDGGSQSPPLSERDIWVQGNLRQGLVYGFGAEGVVMKWQCLSVSNPSSSINNYEARKMAIRLNESVSKVAKEAREQELQEFRKQVEEDRQMSSWN